LQTTNLHIFVVKVAQKNLLAMNIFISFPCLRNLIVKQEFKAKQEFNNSCCSPGKLMRQLLRLPWTTACNNSVGDAIQ